MQIYLSVIIPAYNEEHAIRAGKLKQVKNWLLEQPFTSELIVINDDSKDNTAALAQMDASRVITIPHAGKAAAITTGIQTAQGRWILFSDMDQATPISEALRLLETLEAGNDVAIGSRGVVRNGAPLGRYLLSWGQIFLKSVLLDLHLVDTQCGFKAFCREVALAIIDHLVVYSPTRYSRINGPSVTSGFDVEFLFVAQHLGFRICEVPVHWNYQTTHRVNLLHDSYRGLRDLFMIVLARTQNKYSLIR